MKLESLTVLTLPKNKIDSICEELDERVLLAQNSPFLDIGETDTNIEVKFRMVRIQVQRGVNVVLRLFSVLQRGHQTH